MKIIVAMKQVPQRDAAVQIERDGKRIAEEHLAFEINEPDAYALEEALQLKEKHGGEVVALCAGPERAAQSVREALAKGADRAIHVECDDLANLDSFGAAQRLASAVRGESPDLILTGLQSDDLGFGQTGVIMAQLLDIPHATLIMQVEKQDGVIRVKRELESGWFQWLEMPLPALLTIQSGINKLRYATLLGIKKAKTKEIRKVGPSELGEDPPPRLSLERIYLPHGKKAAQIITGPAAQAAAMLVEKLRFEVRVI
jgi:electron transfer flavoprotein beta subunit